MLLRSSLYRSLSPCCQLAVGTGQPLIGSAILMFSPALTVMSLIRLKSILGFSVTQISSLVPAYFVVTTKQTAVACSSQQTLILKSFIAVMLWYIVRLSVTVTLVCSLIIQCWFFFENNYTCVILWYSLADGKETPICSKGIILKFQVKYGRGDNTWHRMVSYWQHSFLVTYWPTYLIFYMCNCASLFHDDLCTSSLK